RGAGGRGRRRGVQRPGGRRGGEQQQYRGARGQRRRGRGEAEEHRRDQGGGQRGGARADQAAAGQRGVPPVRPLGHPGGDPVDQVVEVDRRHLVAALAQVEGVPVAQAQRLDRKSVG